MRSVLNSSVVWVLATEAMWNSSGRKGILFRTSLYVWYLQYWALCDDLVVGSYIDTAPQWILWKRSRDDWSLRASRDGHYFAHNGSNNKKKTGQQQQNHRHRTDSSLSHWGLKCILLVPNLCPRFCCCWSKRNVQLAWKPSNYCNVSPWRNTELSQSD